VSRKCGTAESSRSKVESCRDVIALLTEYMEGDLAPDLERRLEEHLGACSACDGFLESLKSTRAAVSRLRSADIPPDCHARLRAFLRRELRM
jgi:anti-sigma factor RsiW